MTIQVKITNCDQGDDRVIAVYEASPNGENEREVAQMSGGQFTTTYVHTGQILIVRELRNG